MKKRFAILLVGVLLISLVGCQNSSPKFDDDPNITPLGMTPGNTTSSYDGIEIQIDSLNWNKEESKTTLVVVWNNRTEYEVTYGASFAIERLDGEEWVSCAIPEDPVFDLMAYLLPAGRLTNEFYTLTDMFDVSSPGTYRFITDCLVPDNAEQSTKCELTAEFTLGDVKCPDDSKEAITELEWAAQYIRTNGYQDGAKFPRVEIIKNAKELNEYYTANNQTFDLERKDKVYSDTTIGFLDACDQYDEAFFGENYLIFVLLEEGSGSVRHEVRSVGQTSDKKISVSIDSILPDGAGTSDMAEWHIILELSRDVLVEAPSDVLVYWGDVLRWNGSAVEPPKPEPAFKTPPAGTLRTPEGDVTLAAAGYDWTVLNSDGTATTTIADQASRPLPQSSLEQVFLNNQHAETIYAAIPGTDTYTPTRSAGYLLKLNWEDNPDSVTFTSWPEDVWVNPGTPEETVYSQGDYAFYARTGGFIYEFVATWNDDGDGYHGTASYYVYVYDKYAAYAYCAEPPV